VVVGYCPGMRVDIQHQPSYAIAYLHLGVGETVHIEPDAMAVMSDGIEVKAGLGGGGLRKALKRTLASESAIFGQYTGQAEGCYVGVAPKYPGDMMAFDASGGWNLQQGSLVAYSDGVDVDVNFSGLKGVMMKEGISFLHAEGSGTVVVSSYGAISSVKLGQGQQFVVDTGHLVGFNEHVSIKVGPLTSLGTSFLTGEGLVARLNGPGEVLIQTRAEESLRSWLFPKGTQS